MWGAAPAECPGRAVCGAEGHLRRGVVNVIPGGARFRRKAKRGAVPGGFYTARSPGLIKRQRYIHVHRGTALGRSVRSIN
jgi:hypothetical protein